MPKPKDNPLGTYLRDRRAKLDPVALGVPLARRRTPGLRREEVAQRAHVSATWYTWLEQGRGGSPSADVLDRIARALLLTPPEREHLFFIALGRPPEVHYTAQEGIAPRIQRVLDALDASPALVRTVTWELVAWNRAAAAIFGFDGLAPGHRNILRRMFSDPGSRTLQTDWHGVARFAVAAFRAETARAGASENVRALVEELRQLSPEFDVLWRANDVEANGDSTKRLRHPAVGVVALEYSAFSVAGRPDLSLVIYNPATPKDADKVRTLVRQMPAGSRPATRRRKG